MTVSLALTETFLGLNKELHSSTQRHPRIVCVLAMTSRNFLPETVLANTGWPKEHIYDHLHGKTLALLACDPNAPGFVNYFRHVKDFYNRVNGVDPESKKPTGWKGERAIRSIRRRSNEALHLALHITPNLTQLFPLHLTQLIILHLTLHLSQLSAQLRDHPRAHGRHTAATRRLHGCAHDSAVPDAARLRSVRLNNLVQP